MDKTKGKIERKRMGCFLNPPTHPEYYMSIKGAQFSMSLSAAVECEWLDDRVKDAAKKILKSWKPLPITDESVKDWIHHVLGYFKNCYTRDKNNRSVNDNSTFYIADKSIEMMLDKSYHLGVLLIQEYYPEYCPNDDDFNMAYWGNKAVATA